jgi:hypothetical protein
MTSAKTNSKSHARTSLADLIARYQATGLAIVAADTAEHEAAIKHPRPEAPRVLGGMSETVQMQIGSKSHTIPGTPYYYRTHAEIDRSTVGAERKRLHAELKRAEKAADKALHPTVRASAAKSRRAHEADSDARAAIMNYRPQSHAEAVAFLRFLADEPNEVREMRHCLRNVIAAIKGAAQ